MNQKVLNLILVWFFEHSYIESVWKILDHLKAKVVPTFHSYGHITSCQLLFNPNVVRLTGKADFEQTERTWALLKTNGNRTVHVSVF